LPLFLLSGASLKCETCRAASKNCSGEMLPCGRMNDICLISYTVFTIGFGGESKKTIIGVTNIDQNIIILEDMRIIHQEIKQEIHNSREELKQEFKAEVGEIIARLDKIDEDLTGVSKKLGILEAKMKEMEEKVMDLSKDQKEDHDMILRLQRKQ
ncbi:hypothetical protein JD844_005754, partial [Phrynosoma platyrhinos]